jgi:ubiquinone/menaquinone biosynthesis C-methylase UbiE
LSPSTRLIGIESAHRRLAEQAELESAARVLEIGCGTGNLALLVKRMRPQLEVVGLDPDAKALQRARRKARRVELSLELDTGFADALPYPDGSFDGVLSSLMFHHLEADLRVASLREVLRVLRPGGSLHHRQPARAVPTNPYRSRRALRRAHRHNQGPPRRQLVRRQTRRRDLRADP